MEILWLFAFLAGFIDSVVGGGGLIQLPALLLFLPASLALPTVFGTNKFSSICGTTAAALQYSRKICLPWRSIIPAATAAFVFAFLGARIVTGINPQVLRFVVLALLIAVAFYTYRRGELGNLHAPQFAPGRERVVGIVVGGAIGFYDGFFGPGTGSFLIFIFIGLFGFDFLTASASAKVINLATNLAAVIYFGWTDQILYRYAIPMGICNVLGSLLGTRLAILKGNRFVRAFFLIIVSMLIVRYGWEVFSS